MMWFEIKRALAITGFAALAVLFLVCVVAPLSLGLMIADIARAVWAGDEDENMYRCDNCGNITLYKPDGECPNCN